MAGGSLVPSQDGDESNHRKRKAPASSSATAAAEQGEEEDEEEDIEELEREVADLGRRVLERRCEAATRLVDAAVARLTSLRPPASVEVTTGPPPVAATSLAEAEQERHEKLNLFKSKLAANIDAMPMVLKKMNDSLVEIDKLEQASVRVHPVFQTKR